VAWKGKQSRQHCRLERLTRVRCILDGEDSLNPCFYQVLPLPTFLKLADTRMKPWHSNKPDLCHLFTKLRDSAASATASSFHASKLRLWFPALRQYILDFMTGLGRLKLTITSKQPTWQLKYSSNHLQKFRARALCYLLLAPMREVEYLYGRRPVC
jgi:hypothetical protein